MSYVVDVGQGPSYSFCLVIVLLLVFLYDDVGVLLLHRGRKCVHISDHNVRGSCLPEYGLALAKVFHERAIAADCEVRRHHQISRICAFRKFSITYYDDILTHSMLSFQLSEMRFLLLSHMSPARGIL